jgi:hypothetical protein
MKTKKVFQRLAELLLVMGAISAILLMQGCQGAETKEETKVAVVLEPDYAQMAPDAAAETIPDDDSEKVEVAQGGGSVTISFMDNVEYNLSTGLVTMYYQNPNASTHNVVVQVILISGENEYLLAQSGILQPGYQVTSLTADEDAPQLSQGGYNGKLKLLFYDPETGERAIVDTDIPCTVTVTG